MHSGDETRTFTLQINTNNVEQKLMGPIQFQLLLVFMDLP